MRMRPTISLRAFLLLTLVAGAGAAWWLRWDAARRREQSRIVPTQWDVSSGQNVLWSKKIGSQNYSTPAASGGKVFVGSNNGGGFVNRYPASVDLGVMLCLDARTGSFLWQHSNQKLATGRVNDWPRQGVGCSPVVEGDRLWYTSNRGELCCLDTEGFHDEANDGPVYDEPHQTLDDADVVWRRDLIGEFGAFPHNGSCGDCEIVGRRLFIVVPNGVDQGHLNLPSSEAPAFMCFDKTTGEVLWQDDSSSAYILHGQWGTPVYGVLGGAEQVIFPGGDGWLYSFAPEGDGRGGGKLLWKFDCNPKASRWELGGRGTRNNLLRAPVIHDGLVYTAVGQDPEHGEGVGRLVCIDPTQRGDISSEIVIQRETGDRVPRRRRGDGPAAFDPDRGEAAAANPNSGLVWEYRGFDLDGDGELAFEETMHRTLSRPSIKGGLLVIADLPGLVHCLDARTGRLHWTHDAFAGIWSSPLIAGGHVYVTDEDGITAVYALSADPQEAMLLGTPRAEMYMEAPIYATPTPRDNVLYMATRDTLYAIRSPRKP